MNKKEFGNELESYVANKLKPLDPYSKPTRGSGCGAQIGDVDHKMFYIECKNRNTKDITIHEDVWNKLLLQLPIKTNKIPMYVLGNVNKKRWAVLDFDDLIRLLT